MKKYMLTLRKYMNKVRLYNYYNGYECFEPIFEQIKLDYEKQTQWSLQEKKLL